MDEEIPTDFKEYKQMRVYLTPDEKGYVGRECPSCGKYFKIIFDTNLSITELICPYCRYKDDLKKFITKDQVDYITTYGANEVLTKAVEDLMKSLHSLKNFKPSNTPIKFDITHYKENDLETEVTCDNCGLNFSIYGVFSDCPYCGQLNAKVIFDKSIEFLFKKLELCKDERLEPSDKDDNMVRALIGCVSAFDALGKPLRDKFSKILPQKPKNLFQNLDDLNKVLYNKRGKHINDYISQEDYNFLLKMFQVRHIYDHNAGVIDSDFVKNVPEYRNSLGRKYTLLEDEVSKFLYCTRDLGTKIFYEFERKNS